MPRLGEDPELDALTASVIRAFLEDPELQRLYRRHQERIRGELFTDEQLVSQLEALLAYWQRRDTP
jgi:hypothetical protein